MVSEEEKDLQEVRQLLGLEEKHPIRTDNQTSMTRRDMSVYKKNELIQNSRFSLTLMQQKTLSYLISMIKPNDAEDTIYHTTVKKFCEVAGIEMNKFYYQAVKDDIQALADASVWVRTPDGKDTLIRWLDIIKMEPNEGTIEIQFSKSISPYLFFMVEEGNYTKYSLMNILPMRSKYSPQIYELLKSYANRTELMLTIDELKQKLQIEEEYSRFVDFRRNIIDKAMDEINQYSDLLVKYALLKEGKKVIGIHFYIEKKGIYDSMITRLESKKKLNAPAKKIKRQDKEAVEEGDSK